MKKTKEKYNNNKKFYVVFMCQKITPFLRNMVSDISRNHDYASRENILIFTDTFETNLRPNEIYIPNHLLQNVHYKHINSIFFRRKWKKDMTSIEKTLYYFTYMNTDYDYIYLIEDDVFFPNTHQFDKFLEYTNQFDHDFMATTICTQKQCPKWNWWSLPSSFQNKLRSFNPICRLSKNLIMKCKEFALQHHKFEFYEIMFGSLCLQNNLSYHELSFLNEYITYDIRYLPKTISKKEINKLPCFCIHPIKNDEWKYQYWNKIFTSLSI
jgi:hypothetical protein